MSFLKSCVEVETEIWRSYDSRSVTMATRASYSEENNLKWKNKILNKPCSLQEGCQLSPLWRHVVLLARGSCSAALAEVFWCTRPRPVISLADRLWSASERLPLHHRAVPHWACQSGWLAARRQYLTSLCEMQQCWNGALHEILLFPSAIEKNAFIWSFTVHKPEHASDNGTRRSALHKLQLHLNLIWLNLCASGQMESG